MHPVGRWLEKEKIPWEMEEYNFKFWEEVTYQVAPLSRKAMINAIQGRIDDFIDLELEYIRRYSDYHLEKRDMCFFRTN